MGVLFGRGGKTREERFWEWFGRNSDDLAAVTDCRERVCDSLAAQMRKIDKNLTFAFGPAVDGRREFIVSADGIRAAIPAVKKLVEAAPSLPGWSIIAFRPPGDLGSVSLGGRELGPDDIWFSSQESDGLVHLALYIRDLSRETFRPLAQGAFILLDHCLGEYAVMTRVGGIDFQPLPIDPVAERLRPFSELPGVVG